ncbi:hypothetical protein TSUD_277050 [Trifolium subterraneum]|uniref:Proline dehydrogenase n=1 Tax=Trifolium subterraneum TaxID=3900 RepID=A0A2Z6MTX5_TRISU|nr:hypothetical protein TSUD_277050 [Trifolium subterraneum]
MATRVVPQKIIKNLRYKTTTKPLNSSHPSAAAAVVSLLEKQPAITPPPPSPQPSSHQSASFLDLNDAERLFSAVPTSTLLRSSAVLHATAIGPVVDVGIWAMQSKLLQMGIMKDAVMAVTKRTFYEHFCAGEDAVAAGRSIRSVNEAGLRGMLVYGVEDAHDNEGCNRNLNGFLHTVDVSKSLPPSSVSF